MKSNVRYPRYLFTSDILFALAQVFEETAEFCDGKAMGDTRVKNALFAALTDVLGEHFCEQPSALEQELEQGLFFGRVDNMRFLPKSRPSVMSR